MFIYSWKEIDEILTHFGDALCKKEIFYFYIFYIFIAHGV